MKIKLTWLSILLIFILAGCSNNQTNNNPENTPINPTETISNETQNTIAPTEVIEPTPVVPTIALINEEGIVLSDYEDELRRYESAMINLEKEFEVDQANEIVLQTMIETVLLAQGARANGFELMDETYNNRLEKLIQDSGGETQFQQWLTNNFYTAESFERLYKLQIEAVWMRDILISEVPAREEQIRARQILVSSKTLAEDIYIQLENGTEFDYYAWGYDQLSGGELGWFPRDYLVLPQIEDAVFNLQPGEYSEVIESTYGYHIIQVLEREVDRQLTQDAFLQKQRKALATWLSEQKENSSVILNQN
jgi:peptidyl-prolyl cis-trans isomerase C